jgi:hypothetical protein
LSLEDFRVYPEYHLENEKKYSGVFPKLCNLGKKYMLKVSLLLVSSLCLDDEPWWYGSKLQPK